MNVKMDRARMTLGRLLEQSDLTSGMSVRVRGDHLLLGRDDMDAPGGEPETVDRVRLTRLSETKYGLSVRRHTGRWERTPFSGSMPEMVEVMQTYMQHLVAPW